VTNDDGIDSPGLHALAAAAREAGLEVIVAAPSEQATGAGAAISAVRREGRTVVARRELPGLDGVEAWAVDAQPGHIVVAALNGWFDPAPDLVLPGINQAAGHPTLTALRSVAEADGDLVQRWLAAAPDADR
jgi:5'-nucleotidase